MPSESRFHKLALVLVVAAPVTLHGAVKMPAIFGDHMVLQQGVALPVWGTADPGEKISVTIGSVHASATADDAGKWKVKLAPLQANSTATTLVVTGKNTLTFTDVLVGEVWLCSGQSNMEFNLHHELHGAETLASAHDPGIRLFLAPHITALEPATDFPPSNDVLGKWVVCSPEVLAPDWGNGFSGYSAVSYYFGHELSQVLKQPIGLIDDYFGGTPAEAWTSVSALEKEPSLRHFVDVHNQLVGHFAQATAEMPARMTAYQAAVTAWEAKGGRAYEEQMAAWKIASEQANLAGKVAPPRPTPPSPKPVPPMPDGGWTMPANLYNGMLAPVIPFAIRGAIWYQGENNVAQAREYGTLFRCMISDWRDKWSEGDFPFLFVQLPAFKLTPLLTWPLMRESQARALALPNTGMITAIDLGNPAQLHPVDKRDVGRRLAALARHQVYGESIPDRGPAYASMQIQGNAVRITFAPDSGELVIGRSPWTAPGVTPPPLDRLVDFLIAGEDHKWIHADARIDGNGVVISSAQVTAPIAVRYDWANCPDGNLYNKTGWPAFPFRTDHWVDTDAINN